ncbi:MAG: hypothetical protein HC847_12210 [Hydrococcus sp. RU_2_2]|nr:hypothetical protein [Hydrococcus sp. RU_2_2]NJP21101.1 hypothetical protein [Hydrococcus sp. CRU_1_1]NJQ98876.1 hypothetical protein [Hydrococcus sp. CSU_1_8]
MDVYMIGDALDGDRPGVRSLVIFT